MNIDQIREAIGAKVSETVQVGVETVMRMHGGPERALQLGCNTAICSLVPILPFLSNVNMKDQNDLPEAINYETLLFAALIVVKMHGGFQVVRDIRKEDGTKGVECVHEVNFGPSVLCEALQDWKTLTNKDPAKYLNAGLLKALAFAERESTAPFDEFMKKRINGPTSSTLN